MRSDAKVVFFLCALLVAWLLAAYVFRDGLGLVVFLVLGLATFLQLVRVAIAGGKRKTLKDLWGAFKDAFWGIG